MNTGQTNAATLRTMDANTSAFSDDSEQEYQHYPCTVYLAKQVLVRGKLNPMNT